MQDPDAFRDACDVFGEETALRHLRLFCEDLEGRLTRMKHDRPDDADLRNIAHRTAGRAGFLGFSSLVEASVALEEATIRNAGVDPALGRWAEQAHLAIQYAAGLERKSQAADDPPSLG